MQEKTNVSVATNRAGKLKSPNEVNKMVREKRAADLLRFRTCCCDVRASK